MILNKIYSEPRGLFKDVEFINGVNFIYGKKLPHDPLKSLNSVGKSTFLDLIDFCLLSSFNKNHNKRLHKAKHLLSDFYIVLEFSIEGIDYIIKRNAIEPNYAFFGEITDPEIEKYKLDNLKIKLANLIFLRKDYNGDFTSKWYRNLFLFYLKIQKHKRPKFLDPISYIDNTNEASHNVLQFYLLNLNNKIPNKIHEHRVRERGLQTAVDELKIFVEEKYGLKDTKATESKIQKLTVEIRKLEKTIDEFKLAEQYENAEEDADKLTEQIKAHIYNNHIDKEKVKGYKESIESPDRINTRRINSMYKEISEEFALKVKTTLSQAHKFRKDLAKSRHSFISEEIKRLEGIVGERIELIKSIEVKRTKLFKFLATKEAISDLKEAYGMLSDKKTELSDLESSSRTLIDLEKELYEIARELSDLRVKAIDYMEEIKSEKSEFYELLSSIYSSIYVQYKEESEFTITVSDNKKKKSLIEIDLKVPDMLGKGKNQGRTLVYDLSVLYKNIIQTLNFPRFLIHDGIFDGMDKAHFVAVYEYVEKLKNDGVPIQYIATYNEEGALTKEKFGDSDILTPDRIEEEAILVLSSEDKLFGSDF